MALFGKNKDESGDTQVTPAPATAGNAPADNTFDFDAITRDLDAQNGPSSFDALLAQPVSASPSGAPPTSTSDALSNDPLGMSIPQTPPATSAVPPVSSPDAVLNAPLSPTTATPTTGVAPIANPAANVVTPIPLPKAKKSLPLIPVLGVLGLVAVAIGAQMFMVNSATPTPPAPPVGPLGPPRPATVRSNPVAPPAETSSGPGRSPGIAPASVTPSRGPDVSIQIPAAKGPSATEDLDHALADRLKAYWKQGADAKHRKDYAAARQAWGAALQLRPGHPGFQEAINKLPR